MQIYNHAQFLTETQSPNFKIQPNTIIQGGCLDVMKYLPDNSIDMILTDPHMLRHSVSGTLLSH